VSRVIVFVNQQIWYRTDAVAQFNEYPVGAYVRRINYATGKIYWGKIRMIDGMKDHETIDEEDLPPWAKAWDLLLR